MVKAYSWKFSGVILKVLVRISFLWFTKVLVEVWNVQNGQRKITYNNVPKHYKWGEKDKIDSQWTSCSKVISCQQTKEASCWQGKKVVVAILFPQEIKRKERNLLRRGSNKRGKDCHLQRMMESSQRREDPTQTGFIFICDLPLLQ